MKLAHIEPHYLPTIPYFSALHSCEKIIIEKHEHFHKQTFRNRTHILTSQGKERLIVPITSKHGKVLINEVRIDYAQKWLNNHWRAIESAYRNAPFFEFYAEDLQKILFKKHTFLYDLNLEFLTICLKWLKSNSQIQESMTYEKTAPNGITDLRNVIHPKNEELSSSHFKPTPYTQVFGSKFVAGMSIIDLVFCEGPNARSVIATSAVPQ
jgi:hypothetical protein